MVQQGKYKESLKIMSDSIKWKDAHGYINKRDFIALLRAQGTAYFKLEDWDNAEKPLERGRLMIDQL